jgi:hypothetical protein
MGLSIVIHIMHVAVQLGVSCLLVLSAFALSHFISGTTELLHVHRSQSYVLHCHAG